MRSDASTKLDVLLVEHRVSDQVLVREALADAPGLQVRWHLVESLAAALTHVARTPPDVVILDLDLPDSTGVDTFRRLRRASDLLPIVVLSSVDAEETAISAIREGAQDYLDKGDLTGPMFARVLRCTVERGHLERVVVARERRFRALVEGNQDAIVLLDTSGRIFYASPATEAITGRPVEALLGEPAPNLMHPDDRDAFEDAFQQARDGGAGSAAGSVTLTVRVLRRDEGWRTLEVTLRDFVADPAVAAMVANVRDVTELERRRRELLTYQAVVVHTRDGVLVTNAELDEPGPTIEFANPAMTRMSGYTTQELVGANPRILQGPEADRSKLDALRSALERGEPHRTELVNRSKDGTRYVTELDIVPLRDDNGNIEHFIAVQRDVTSRLRTAEHDRRLAEVHAELAELAQAALEAGVDLTEQAKRTLDAAVTLVPGAQAGSVLQQHPDETWRFTAVHGHGAELLNIVMHEGSFPEEMYAQGPAVIREWHPGPALGPAAKEALYGPAGRAGQLRATLVVPVWIDGQLVTWLLLDNFNDPDAFSDESVAIGRLFARNVGMVTKRLALERELDTLARTDQVTGLPNRRAAEEHLQRSPHAQGGVSLFFLDLDSLKAVNEAYGHAIGDALLRTVSARLREVAPEGAEVCRWGGDEFLVILNGSSDLGVARRTAETLESAFKDGFTVRGGTLMTTVSIGIALADEIDSEEEWTLALRHADMALQEAKRAGKHQATVYSDDLRAGVERRVAIEQRLRLALLAGGDDLTVHYQPHVSLLDGSWIGMEALARWHDPELGPVRPDEFIAAAEATGLIHDLTTRVLDLAIAQAATWRNADRPMIVSINLSTEDLRHDDTVERIFATLERHAVEPALLLVEVTESALMQDVQSARKHLQALRDGGVRVAVDDFGTAYSSLAYLKTLPLDVLKVDKTFVRDLAEGTPEAASAEGIVRAVIALARALGLTVIAEGVEIERQADFLRELGCEVAQGWLYAKAAPPEALRL